MRSRLCCCLLALALSSPIWGQSTAPNGGDFSSNLQPATKVPQGVILVKGAWASASDSTTPVPEGGNVGADGFTNPYFGITYPIPTDWMEKFKGPPPSDQGRYVLLQLNPANNFKGPARGTILITAEDLFFTPLPASNAAELVNYSKDNLQADYKVEMSPTPATIAGRPFTFFAYWSPVAQLHWYVFSTEIRCHAVQIVLTSRDTSLLKTLTLGLNRMTLPAEASSTAGTGGGAVPVCIKDYARDANLITRVEPVFTEHRFNPVPVRITIDKQGKVKHIHFLSAFPDQAKAITDALQQWRFKPYRQGGQPVEVETGILFGRTLRPSASQTAGSMVE
jgi:hypothetical protein